MQFQTLVQTPYIIEELKNRKDLSNSNTEIILFKKELSTRDNAMSHYLIKYLLSQFTCFPYHIKQTIKRMFDHSCHDGSLHRKQEQEAHIVYFQLLGVQIQPREGDNGRSGSSVSEDGGGGAGWSATDGMEDSHRVRQGASWTVFYRVYLGEKIGSWGGGGSDSFIFY